MINCNPETVSTDYDTSDRLYFEPLRLEEVLGRLRARAAGRRRDPVRRADAAEARARARSGRLPDHGHAVRRRRRGRGPRAVRGAARSARASAARSGGSLATTRRRGPSPSGSAFPVLIRPSYVLGGRAMRVCYSRRRSRRDRPAGADRPLPRERDRDRRRRSVATASDTYIGAVMQHVEEAGVHSGDSACVLPAPSLTPDEDAEIRGVVRTLARGTRRRRADQRPARARRRRRSPCSRRTRARRAPCRSRRRRPASTSCKLACEVMAGARLSELHLPEGQSLRHVSVKAAVLPFARFPGADSVLGPEMRATGEVMATAADLPTAFAKAERAAGRPLPTTGTAFLSVRDADKQAVVPVAETLARLGFKLLATSGTADTLAAAGHRRRTRAQGDRGRGRAERRRPDPPRTLQPRRQHPAGLGRAHRRLPHPRGCARRARALHHDALGCRGRGARHRECAQRGVDVAAGTDRSMRRERLSVVASESVGPYTLLRVRRGGIDPGLPGQFFMLEAPGRLLPRPMSLCLAPRGELAFLIDAIGPGTKALCALDPGEELHVLGPLGNGFDLDRERPSARRRRDWDRAAPLPGGDSRVAARRAGLPLGLARGSGRARSERAGVCRAYARHRVDPGRPRRLRVRP